MYLTKKEKNAIYEAIDFISTNIDGADDESLIEHRELIDRLSSIAIKYKNERYKNRVRYYTKKNLKNRT